MTELVGFTVEKQLDATLWRLVTAELSLHECTPAIRGVYSLGFWDGQDSLRARLQDAEDAADRYYEQAFHGKELADVRLRRMRIAADEYWEEVVGPLVAAEAEKRGEAE